MIVRILKINIILYIKLNYMSSNIIRENGAKIVPYWGTKVMMTKTARIYITDNLYLNAHKFRNSRAECLITLRNHACWKITGCTELYYGAGVQVHENGILENGELHMNTGSLIICGYHVKLGNIVSMARNSYILDDDHHPIFNENGERINEPKEIVLGDNVWLGLKTTVLKGARIGNQCVVGANSVISNVIPDNIMVAAGGARPVVKNITWTR